MNRKSIHRPALQMVIAAVSIQIPNTTEIMTLSLDLKLTN